MSMTVTELEDPNLQTNAKEVEIIPQIPKTTKVFARRNKFTASKPSSNNLHYDMKSKKGLAVLFNHKSFSDILPTHDKAGDHHDRLRLESCLTKLNFEVKTYQDLDFDNVKFILNAVANLEETKISCLLIIVLSRGTATTLNAFDKEYDVSHLWRGLKGKFMGIPKMFFIETCSKEQLGYETEVYDSIEYSSRMAPKIPDCSDFLKVHASFGGSKSWRLINGSWFVQTLCDVLNEKAAEYDILQLLTLVTHELAANYELITGDYRANKVASSLPTVETTLTKFLKFHIPENGTLSTSN